MKVCALHFGGLVRASYSGVCCGYGNSLNLRPQFPASCAAPPEAERVKGSTLPPRPFATGAAGRAGQQGPQQCGEGRGNIRLPKDINKYFTSIFCFGPPQELQDELDSKDHDKKRALRRLKSVRPPAQLPSLTPPLLS